MRKRRRQAAQKRRAVKPTTDSISRRLRPKMLASQPVIGRMIALATRYDVSAQVASSIGRRQAAGDVRQRHVHDGGVQHLHEGGEHHGDRDEPGIDLLVIGPLESS